MAGAEAAMHRAARLARQRAEAANARGASNFIAERSTGVRKTVSSQVTRTLPTVTPEEGNAVVGALQTLRQAGLSGAESHLRNASECINSRDWAGSVRESMHAVESVARRLDSKASRGLKPALDSLENRNELHPALKVAFNKLYGYTSDEQGVRHATLGPADSNVGMDEAVFMLGACASFASYLWRKHVAEDTY